MARNLLFQRRTDVSVDSIAEYLAALVNDAQVAWIVRNRTRGPGSDVVVVILPQTRTALWPSEMKCVMHVRAE